MTCGGQRIGGQRAGRIARMDAGLLDVLHHAADERHLAVGNRVDVDFDRVFEKLVDQHGPIGRGVDRLVHVPDQRVLRRSRFPSPGRRARSWGGREPDNRSARPRVRAPSASVAMPLGGCRRPSSCKHVLEPLAVFGHVDHVGAGADDLDAGGFQPAGQIERRLPAELHDHAVRLHAVADVEHVFGRQRLEEEEVRRVVIGRNRLRDSS